MRKFNLYFHIILWIILILVFPIQLNAQSSFTPSNISGLKIWLSSDTLVNQSGGAVAQWGDLSGNNNSAIQPVSLNQPLVISNVINGKPVLEFNGSNSFMLMPSGLLDNLSSLSIFALVKLKESKNGGIFGSNAGYLNLELTSQLNGGLRIQKNSGSNYVVDRDLLTLNNWAFISINGINSASQVWKNGTDITTSAGNAQLPVSPGIQQALGRYASSFGSFYAKFQIAEFIIYDKSLSKIDRERVENYLRLKYSPPVNLGNDTILPNNSFCSILNIKSKYSYSSYLWSTGETTPTINISKSGKYWVDVVDQFGYSSSDTIIVSLPFDINIPKTTVFCFGKSIVWNTKYPKSLYTFQWQDNSVDSVYTITQSGQYFVKIKDANSCIHSDTIDVLRDNFPITASLGPDTNFCAGNPIFLKSGAMQAASYVWSDGSTNSSLPVSVAGQYSVTATSINGCIKKDTVNIGISGVAPTANFSITPTTCIGSTTQFTDASSPPLGNSIVSRIWDFGDASLTSNISSPSYTYADTGSYTAKLTVISNVGCSASLSKKVTIAPYPQPNFIVSNLCERDSVLFNGTAATYGYPITQWGWSFGEPFAGPGFISNLQNPKHFYANAATYTVSLTIQNTFGCITTINKQVLIQPSPVTKYSTSLLCEKQAIIFTDITTVLPTMAIQFGAWDFGDNSAITPLINPIHTYAASGKYILTHTITANNGCSNINTQTLTINPLPKALYTVGNVCVGLPAIFSDTSLISSGSIANRLWTYGAGGATSIVKNNAYTFITAVTPQVKLLVTSNQGCKDSISKTIVVRSTPVATYTATPNNGAPPLNVNFINTSLGAVKYTWALGNTNTDTLQNTHTVYTDTGSYKVSLIAVSQYGCADTSIQTIEVLLPIVNIAVQSVTTLLNNQFMTVQALLVNKGTVDVTSLDITIKINDGTALKEHWTGLLLRGGVVLDTITTSIYMKDSKRFVCVSAVKPNNINDSDSSDNESCTAIDKSTFEVLAPYPVPAGEVLTLPVLIPATNNLDVTVYNSRGQSLGLVHSGTVAEGLQLITVNLKGIEKGVYSFVVVYDGQRFVKRFVIN